jgi:hypothetical protein
MKMKTEDQLPIEKIHEGQQKLFEAIVYLQNMSEDFARVDMLGTSKRLRHIAEMIETGDNHIKEGTAEWTQHELKRSAQMLNPILEATLAGINIKKKQRS